jgi:hypothetical protein
LLTLNLFFKKMSTKIIIILFLTTLTLTSCSEKLILVEDGVSEYQIYVSEKAPTVEKVAARKLQKYILEISGCKIPIITSSRQAANTVFIGFDAVSPALIKDLNISEFGKEEFIIKTSGTNLMIAGGKARGTLYGVLTFLSDYLGCRWYTREVKKIPDKTTLALEQINVRQKPVFEYREAWYREAYDVDWAVHNRINPSMSQIPDSLGGRYEIYPFVHTFYQLVPPKLYFKQNPEYFSMINGKRQGHEAQLCLTNPEVVKIATETVLRWIEEHPGVQLISVDQNDGYGWCECPECQALDEEEGSHSATVLNFVNQIADTIGKIYPDIKLQTLAYAYTEKPPKTIRPHPNVTIRLCHYVYCSAHHLEGCENQRPFVERLEAWGNIARRLTIWDYFTDFAHYMLPFPNFELIKHDVRYYADHKCVGLFAQGSNVPQNGGGEFSELRAWVFAQLMWNPYQDAQILIDEFVSHVYGEAAPFIKTYINMLHEKVTPDSVFFSIYAKPTDGGYLTPELVKKSEELFLQAEQIVTHDRDLLKRVELAHLPILYTRLYFYSTGGKAYLSQQEIPETLIKFERILSEHNITQIAERRDRGDIQKFIERVNTKHVYLTDWWIIGPFDNPEEKGLHIVFPPEQEYDTTKTYSGRNNEVVKWQHFNNKISGYMDFTKIFKDSESGVAYARSAIEMSEDAEVKIGVGSNDGVRLFINNTLVLDNKIARSAEPNQDITTVSLKKGQNILLLKIDQLGGGWGFYFTVIEGASKIRW